MHDLPFLLVRQQERAIFPAGLPILNLLSTRRTEPEETARWLVSFEKVSIEHLPSLSNSDRYPYLVE